MRTKRETALSLVLWALIGLYAVARILQVFPGPIPMLAVVALHVVCPALFALIHAAKAYGWRGMCVFFGLCLLVGNVFENLGVMTGFPFGRYYFTGVMGPKVFFVPVLLGLAYVGMAYLSWTLARIILRSTGMELEGSRVILSPLVASFLMIAWDFSQEPVWATVVKAWIWLDGGPYFGVPLSNFAGWFVVVYVLYQLFALYVRRPLHGAEPLTLSSWRQAVLFYAVSATGNLLLLIPKKDLSLVSDSTGALWRVRDITGTCGLVSIFTMGAFALLAWTRLHDRETGFTADRSSQHMPQGHVGGL
ncbi:MAG TPA: carotenoid biosynthesis protein [Candidatus Eremiobacteraceae bacterium]|nr:carotenoid biosynthesis protein [Candidatus Eremiobacteraceae bacterium]